MFITVSFIPLLLLRSCIVILCHHKQIVGSRYPPYFSLAFFLVQLKQQHVSKRFRTHPQKTLNCTMFDPSPDSNHVHLVHCARLLRLQRPHIFPCSDGFGNRIDSPAKPETKEIVPLQPALRPNIYYIFSV